VLSALCNFARVARAPVASRGEGSLLSWQRPIGLLWRDLRSRPGMSVWMGVLAATLLGVASVGAQQPYALLGQAAPDFALRAAAGGNVRMSEHRGEVVVLSFWSSSCGQCRAQLQALNRSLATYHSAGLTLYGVGVDDDPVRALDFAHSAAVSFAMLLDPAKTVARNYQVDNLPMTVLIDRGGTVRYVLRDYDRASDALYLQRLRALLNE
jgi:peroxiredoxin